MVSPAISSSRRLGSHARRINHARAPIVPTAGHRSAERILLFRFEHRQGPLAGQQFWATPGGALDPGESYAQAACRELLEETGLMVDDPGPQVGQRIASFQMPDGEMVRADERFFLVRVSALEISTERWTDLERR